MSTLRLVTDIDTVTGQKKRQTEQFIEDTMNEEGYRVPSHKLGAKIFSDIDFPEGMTDTEVGKMARLAKLMIASTNMLGYRSRSGILPYSEEEIIKLLGLSSRRGKPFIDKMIRLGVMQKNIRITGNVKSLEFYINPAYFFAGKRISLNLYLLFREHLDPLLPEWVRREFWHTASQKVK